MQSVGNRVGVVEPFLMRMAHGAPLRISKQSRDNMKVLHGKSENRLGITNSNMLSDDQPLRVCKRFYVALILSRLVQVLHALIDFLFFPKANQILCIACYYMDCLCLR